MGHSSSAYSLPWVKPSGRLTAAWPDLFLPKDVRQAWEHQHPSLRRAAAA